MEPRPQPDRGWRKGESRGRGHQPALRVIAALTPATAVAALAGAQGFRQAVAEDMPPIRCRCWLSSHRPIRT